LKREREKERESLFALLEESKKKVREEAAVFFSFSFVSFSFDFFFHNAFQRTKNSKKKGERHTVLFN